jgi:Cytochrome B561, N terminal
VTVLNPVLREIDDVNQALQRLGFGEEKIGVSGLDKLKRLGQLLQVTQYIPNFVTLIPFMEVSQNQEYLLQRVKGTSICGPLPPKLILYLTYSELSNGGCISEFRWNSGSSYNRKPWDESLPTDAQVYKN